MPSRPLALVTGASAGIGLELTRLLVADGHDVALVARREPELHAIARECAARGAESTAIAEDLSKPGAAARVLKRLSGRPVDVLVNNAGFGLHGRLWETDAAAEAALVQVQVSLALELCRGVLPGMLERRAGRILNVSSLYAYVPGPRQAVYAAAKAFLFSLSLSLQAELHGTGVTCTVVLPGPTKTEFHGRAGLGERRGGASAESVARAAWNAAKAGRTLVVPGAGNKAFVGLSKLLPGAALVPLMRRVAKARGV